MNNNTEKNEGNSPSQYQFYPAFFLGLFLGVFGAHRFYTGKIKTGIIQLLTFGGLGLWWFVDMVMILIGKFKGKDGIPIKNINPKLAWSVFVIVCLIGLAGRGKDTVGGSNESNPTASSYDYYPTGVWVEGDQNSVFNRLVVTATGTFAFQTVDFTGDVKGGYSGRWRMEGNSVRFEWGSGASGGSCSGRKIGENALVFGATTFRR